MVTGQILRIGQRMRAGLATTVRATGLAVGLAVALGGCAAEAPQTPPLAVALTAPGTEISRLPAPEPLHALSWSSDASLLAAIAAPDTQVYVWNSATGRLQWKANRAAVPGAVLRDIAFTADGLAVVTPAVGVASDTPDVTLHLLSVLNGKVMRTVFTREARGEVNQATAFALDGDVAAVVMGGTRIGLFETRRWRMLRLLAPVTNKAGQALTVSAVAVDRRRDRLAVASGGLVQLWTLTDGRRVAEFPAYRAGEVTALAFAPADGSLLTAGSLPPVASLPPGTPAQYRWNPMPDKARPPPPAVEQARMLVRRWAPDSSSLLMTYPMGYGAPQDLAVSPDGQRLAVTAGKTDRTEKGFVMMWDVASGAVTGGLVHDDPTPAVLAFSPDGGRLAYTVGKEVVILDLTRPPPPPAPEPPPLEIPPAVQPPAVMPEAAPEAAPDTAPAAAPAGVVS